ncbi:MAG: hypothetical protein LUH14_06925 [Clostridiaceae bacterium]|nr:hypothetical protein [Clostridiaceae bacterium]
MDRKNYFEMLGLPFDPAEGKERVIEKAISTWETSLKNALANESGSKRAAMEAELQLKEDMTACMKNAKSRNEEAKKLKQEKVGQLEKLIEIFKLAQTGTPEVTLAQVKNLALRLKLSENTVRKVYQDNGFVIQKPNNSIKLKDYFLDKMTIKDIDEKLQSLKTMKSERTPWADRVKDLYDFVCYCSGGRDEDCADFHKKKTEDLRDVLQAMSSTYATDNSKFGHLMSDLITAGTSSVFRDEETRKKYERSCRRRQLESFFALLKVAPESFKKDPIFADSCIRNIEKEFPDYNLALALYNTEAGIINDPYEPLEAFVHITCGVCGIGNKFRSQEEAQKGKCNTCGSSLYLKCPGCEKLVPASADRCSCGFLLTEMRFFDQYIQEAEFALQEMDIQEAKKKLVKVENANPKSSKLLPLRRRVEQMSELFDKYIKNLENLIDSKKYFEANQYISVIAKEVPKLNIDSQKKKIHSVLDSVVKMMPAKDDPLAADKCIDIIREVKDYEPAVEMLRTLKPKTPSNIRAAVSGTSKLKCVVNWTSTKEKGVKYIVVRKRDERSKNHTDGKVIAENIDVLEAADQNIEPGICYFYTVFACREGIYSDGISEKVAYYAEIDPGTLRAESENKVCRLNWVLPPNASGVKILRKEGTMPGMRPDAGTAIVAENAASSYTDTRVNNGITYYYRLICLYPAGTGFETSKSGVTVSLTPEKPPVPVHDVNAKVNGSLVSIQWKPDYENKNAVSIRQLTKNADKNMVGVVQAGSDLNSLLGNGKTFGVSTTDTGKCNFEIPKDSSYQIAVVVSAGSLSVISAIHNISSIERCEIDKKQSRIESGKLILLLKNLPKNLARIHYIAAPKTSDKAPWAAKEDAMNKALDVIRADDYEKDGMIVIDKIPNDAVYVTVIGEYQVLGGQVIYSEPSKFKMLNKTKEKITYSISWIKTGLFGGKCKNGKLILDTEAQSIPEMVLVYKTDGHIPMRLDDPKIGVLYTVEEQEADPSQKRYEIEIGEDKFAGLPANAELRLMLSSEEEAVGYEIVPGDIGSLKNQIKG